MEDIYIWKAHTYERYEVNGVYSVECTRWSVLGGVYSVEYSVECTRWSVHGGVYTVESTRWSLHDGVYTVVEFRTH